MELQEKRIDCILLGKACRILQSFISNRTNVCVLDADKSCVSKHTVTPWSFETCIT